MKPNISLSEYIGVNRALTPGIRVLNNFLSALYGYNKQVNISLFENFKLIQTGNPNNVKYDATMIEDLELINKSYKEWIKAYSIGSYYGKPLDKTACFFPINERLIFDDGNYDRLRQLPYKLLWFSQDSNKDSNKNIYIEDLVNQIRKFLFNNDNHNDIHQFVHSALEDVVKDDTKNRTYMQLDNVRRSEGNYYTEVAKKFTEDISKMIYSDIFSSLDVYSKINYLTLLLNFYILQYLINRINYGKKQKTYMLFKGSSDFDNELFHSSCLENFNDIRQQMKELCKNYFREQIKTNILNNDNEKCFFVKQNDDIYVEKDQKSIQLDEFFKDIDIGASISDESGKNIVKENREKLKNIINDSLLGDKNNCRITLDNLVSVIMKLNAKASSSVSYAIQIFSTQGREAKCVYPQSQVRQKYFVMSREITDLFVRLYFAHNNKIVYDTVENFTRWLKDNYLICIGFSKEINQYIDGKPHIKQIRASIYRDNYKTFISTLDSLQCIIKLSDTSHIITLPGNKGVVKSL